MWNEPNTEKLQKLARHPNLFGGGENDRPNPKRARAPVPANRPNDYVRCPGGIEIAKSRGRSHADSRLKVKTRHTVGATGEGDPRRVYDLTGGCRSQQLTSFARAGCGTTNSGGPTGQDGRCKHYPGAQRVEPTRTDPCPEVVGTCRWNPASGTPSDRTGERGFQSEFQGWWYPPCRRAWENHTPICRGTLDDRSWPGAFGIFQTADVNRQPTGLMSRALR